MLHWSYKGENLHPGLSDSVQSKQTYPKCIQNCNTVTSTIASKIHFFPVDMKNNY